MRSGTASWRSPAPRSDCDDPRASRDHRLRLPPRPSPPSSIRGSRSSPGRNESGKSTLLRAVRGALYGIDAGGQGRPVDRSDWARYEPWTRGGYGLALTYKLDDGRRIRVARRLDTREQSVQVLELGGSELTDELRSGRVGDARTVPSRHRRGGLLRHGVARRRRAAHRRAGKRAAAGRVSCRRRSSASPTPAAGSPPRRRWCRIREAMDRVGSERRATSPLGVATARLEVARSHPRGRPHAAGRSCGRPGAARGRSTRRSAPRPSTGSTAERARLAGRLAEVAEPSCAPCRAGARGKLQAADVEATASYARFPLDVETEVTALGGELAQAKVERRRVRMHDGRPPSSGCGRSARGARRSHRGVAAIGPLAEFGSDIGERSQRLRGELIAVAGAARRNGGDDAREAALRREIAATGLRSLPASVIDELLPKLEAAGRGGRRFGVSRQRSPARVGAAAAVSLRRARTPSIAALVAACSAYVAAGGVRLASLDTRLRRRRRRARPRQLSL